MNYLIVGNANSIYLKSVIERTMIAFNDRVCILSESNDNYADFYKENNVTVILEKRKTGIINTLLSGIYNIKVLSRKYDAVFFHFITDNSLAMIPFTRIFGNRLSVSFWGSDLLRCDKKKKMALVSLRLANEITVITPEMLDKFHMLYGMGYDKKLRMIDFGLDIVDIITQINEDYYKIREKYNIEYNKVVVAIGYNGNPAQQHVDVLKQIMKLPEEIKSRIHLLLRLTYSIKDDDYVQSVKKMIEQTGCSSLVIEGYLSDEEIAEITVMSDIFIHAQISDARSATICEHLYANCLLFNPEWIEYSTLKDKVFFKSYKNFDELYKLLLNNIEKKCNSKYFDYLRTNAKNIYSICSWDTYIPKWRKLYLDCKK